jgi:tRNA (guanine37-N1)-methyltransferase
MLGLKVNIINAQQVKQYLIDHDLFDKRYGIKREGNTISFPVIREFSPPFDFDAEFEEGELDERQVAQSLREAIWPFLSEEEQKHIRTAYDIVGSIAIIDIMSELAAKEKLIGEKIMENNKTVKTVLKKIGGHQGVYRTQQMQCVAGEDTRETVVVENGIKLRVNVENSYYSIRMATERKRIAAMIKPGEHVLCLFSGIGPYPITFGMHTQADDIVGIEINPAAHELAVENLAKNRCMNIRLFCGDAHDVIPKLAENGEKFDRVTMPLPHTADEFMPDVMSVAKKGTIIHFYAFLEEDAFNKHVTMLREIATRCGFSLAKYDVIRAGQHAPRIWRICIDAELGPL